MIRVWTVEDNASYRRAVIDEINGSQELSCEREFEACEPLLEELRTSPPPDVILSRTNRCGFLWVQGGVHSRKCGRSVSNQAQHGNPVCRANCPLTGDLCISGAVGCRIGGDE